MALTGIAGSIAHICAASDALIGFDDDRARRAQKLLDEALDQLAPHPDAPEVFRFVDDQVEMRTLAPDPDGSAAQSKH